MPVLRQSIVDDPKRGFILNLLAMTPEKLADTYDTLSKVAAGGDDQAKRLMAVADAIGACLHPEAWEMAKGSSR